jgi:cyclase
MKKMLIPLVTLSLFIFASVTAAQDSPPPKKAVTATVEKLNDHLVKIVLKGQAEINVVASTGPDGILLIDTGYEDTAEKLKSTLSTMGKGKVSEVILTHEHADHTGGIVTFADAKILANERVKKELTSGYNLMREIPESALPDQDISAKVSFKFNGEEVQVIPMPGSHSDSDMVVYFPASKVVCVGGITNAVKFPNADVEKGGSYAKFPEITTQLIDTFPDDVIYIPGHGANFKKADLRAFNLMLTTTADVVKKGLAAGKDVATLQKENVLKEWNSFNGYVTTNFWIKILADVQSGKTTPAPKGKSMFEALFLKLKASDVATVLTYFQELKKAHASEYDINENSLNMLGYYLLQKKRIDDAIALFKANVTEYPKSWNVYDSLAEAFMYKGDKEQAILNYKKSLELNPDNGNATFFLKKLQST